MPNKSYPYQARLYFVAEPVLALCEYMSFAKSWLEKGYSSQAETNILMKDFD